MSTGTILKKFGVYEGELLNGKANGYGTFTWNNGDFYKGNWVDDLRTGYGEFYNHEGGKTVGFFFHNIYIGIIRKVGLDGIKYTVQTLGDASHGDVEILYESGNRYNGMWYGGSCNGYGCLTTSKGLEFKGFFLQGRFVGDVFRIGNNKCREKIPFEEAKYVGKICIHFRNGDKYQGDSVDGYCDGNGLCIYENGDEYDGQWSKGLRSGSGIYRTSGYTYKGDFKDDTFDGKGSLKYVSGLSFEGSFKDGLRNGSGILEFPDKFVCIGNWAGNSRSGSCNYSFPDDITFDGLYRDDKLISGSFVSDDEQIDCTVRNNRIIAISTTDKVLSEAIGKILADGIICAPSVIGDSADDDPNKKYRRVTPSVKSDYDSNYSAPTRSVYSKWGFPINNQGYATSCNFDAFER